jgi:hypothetical protein
MHSDASHIAVQHLQGGDWRKTTAVCAGYATTQVDIPPVVLVWLQATRLVRATIDPQAPLQRYASQVIAARRVAMPIEACRASRWAPSQPADHVWLTPDLPTSCAVDAPIMASSPFVLDPTDLSGGLTNSNVIPVVFMCVCVTLCWPWSGRFQTVLVSLQTFIGIDAYVANVRQELAPGLSYVITRAARRAVVATTLAYVGAYSQ